MWVENQAPLWWTFSHISQTFHHTFNLPPVSDLPPNLKSRQGEDNTGWDYEACLLKHVCLIIALFRWSSPLGLFGSWQQIYNLISSPNPFLRHEWGGNVMALSRFTPWCAVWAIMPLGSSSTHLLHLDFKKYLFFSCLLAFFLSFVRGSPIYFHLSIIWSSCIYLLHK